MNKFFNTNEDIIDTTPLNQLMMLNDIDWPFIKQLFQDYINESKTLIEQLTYEISHHKLDDLMHTAHSLKSSSATLGLKEVVRSCQKIEVKARENKKVEEEDFRCLIISFEQAKEEINYSILK